MKWGIRRKQHAAASAQCVQEDESGGKGKKGKAFSFSPLSWLGKLTSGKDKPGAAASTPKNNAKRTSPRPAVVAPGRNSGCSPAAADVVPRRLSVGNDSADVVAARRHSRRHCSLGGDRELPPLGHLIPFSLSASPALPPSLAVPSDTDAGPARRNRRRRSSRRLSTTNSGSVSGRRSSFSVSGRKVRVRSPRPAELERLAVVRRTRDPQRAFRESMVEMIGSSSGGWRPEEVERLLACYLSLNAKEHHECIVKVFRQVWFEYINLLKLHRRQGLSQRR